LKSRYDRVESFVRCIFAAIAALALGRVAKAVSAIGESIAIADQFAAEARRIWNLPEAVNAAGLQIN
jgi:hypothetical protein